MCFNNMKRDWRHRWVTRHHFETRLFPMLAFCSCACLLIMQPCSTGGRKWTTLWCVLAFQKDQWVLINHIYLLSTFANCVSVWYSETCASSHHPATPSTHRCCWEMGYSMVSSVSKQDLFWYVCVFGVGGEVARWGKRVFGTLSGDWWTKLGGPRLTERRSVSVTSALNCLPPDRSSLGGGRRSPAINMHW